MADYYQMNNLLLAAINKMICETNENNYPQTIEILNKYGGIGDPTVQLCKKLTNKIATNSKSFLASNQSNNLPVFWKAFFEEMQENRPT